MRIASMLALALICNSLYGQCPQTPVNLQGGHCTGDTLWIAGAEQAARIDWYRDGQLVKTVTNTVQPSPETIVAGGNGLGAAADQFYEPTRIWLDDKDTLYIADAGNLRVQQFPPGSTSATNGVTIIQQSEPINGGWDLTGLSGDGKGNIYTEESGIVFKWPRGATNGTQVAAAIPASGSLGSAQFSITSLAPIAVDPAGNVYVVEPANNRVQKWTPGATAGVTVAGGNGPGAAANQLDHPFGIHVDNAGNIYVTDMNNSRVQKWAPGATSGVTVAGGNGIGSAANQLNMPQGVFADQQGNVYVADPLNARVQWWAPGATTGVTVTGGNGQGRSLNQLATPTDVFLSADGWLYTCDNSNWRVVKNRPNLVYSIDTTLVANVPGVYTATVAGPDGCTVPSQPLTVLATTTIRVDLTATPNPVCSADSVVFTASADTTPLAFTYQWQVNNAAVSDTGAIYVARQPVTAFPVSCSLSADAVCVSGTSNTILLQVNPSPVIPSGQVFSFPYGSSIQLSPRITGDISTYTWTPATGLNDPTTRNPVADPPSTTIYTLEVVGTDGCSATAPIKVDVYIPLSLANAFTPNGDGRNDVFYILGGPPGLIVHEMIIFDRWGQRVFQAQNVRAGDPSVGWTGRLAGRMLPAGTYVYLIEVRMPDGNSQTVKGTVELIR